jgi:gliding motility-associated-like protein
VLPAPASAPGVSDTLYYCLFQQNVPPLSATASSGATLNWYDANGNSIPTPTPATNPLGVTTYYVSQNIGPCSSGKDSIKVIIVTKPSAVFVSNPTPGSIILAGQPVTFTPINVANPLVIYAWNFGANGQPGNASNMYNPTYGYANAGTYCPKLVVTSTQTGCKDSSTLCIDIISGIDVIAPNIFSPNGDGINEMFSVKAEGMSNLTCQIYDRWGLKISEWTGLNGGWDGTDSKNGKAVSDGTYYYIIQATDVLGKNHEYHGYLQLLK